MSLDDPDFVAKAMARPLRSARLAGGSRPLSLDELEYDDKPLSADVLDTGEHQDAEAERMDAGEFDPDDRWDRPHVPDWDATL